MRHREVGDLYERTGDMRPKLARSLDDAGRRERTFSYTKSNERLILIVPSL